MVEKDKGSWMGPYGGEVQTLLNNGYHGQKEKGTRADVEVCERNYTLGRNM